MPSALLDQPLVVALLVILVIVLVVALVLRRRAQGTADAEPAEPESLETVRFHLARRNGYDPAEVDGLVDKLAALPDTPDGHREALVIVEDIRFHLAYRGGYDPGDVDAFVDRQAAHYRRLLG